MEMLEHVPDPAAVVRACATLVKPGGRVFFSTINRNPKAYLFAVVGAEYLLRLLPPRTHDYDRFITPAELTRDARVAGLDVDRADRPALQPADAPLPARLERRRQLSVATTRDARDGDVDRAGVPTPWRAMLFDLDGTLADTAPDLAAAANAMRVARGLEPVPLERLRPMASHGARGLVGVAFECAPGDADYEALRVEFLDRYEAALAVHSTLFDGMPDVLDALEARGIAWGIVTNKAMRFTAPLAAKLGLATRAGAIVGGDTTAFAKPHPAPLLHAADLLDIPPSECIYVGDDLRDMTAGHAAGMGTVAAAWGYCGRSEPTQWQADVVCDEPRSLLTLL